MSLRKSLVDGPMTMRRTSSYCHIAGCGFVGIGECTSTAVPIKNFKVMVDLSNTQRPKKESCITLDVEMEDYYRIKNEGKNSTT